MNCCPCLFSTFYRGTYGTGKYWFFSSHSDIVIPDVTPELISIRSSLFHQLSCVFWNICISVSDPACGWWRTMTFCLLMAATGHRICWVQSISSQRCLAAPERVQDGRNAQTLRASLRIFDVISKWKCRILNAVAFRCKGFSVPVYLSFLYIETSAALSLFNQSIYPLGKIYRTFFFNLERQKMSRCDLVF